VIAAIWCNRQTQLERVSCLQIYGAVRESCDADFRPLQVRQNADITAMMSSLSPDVLGDLNMICLIAMAEVQSKHIHPRTE
jgi:hypothetical protein